MTHGQSQRGVGKRVGGGDGWGMGEIWGLNGDNFIWTTIKQRIELKKENGK